MLTPWNPHSSRGTRDPEMSSTRSFVSKKPFTRCSSHSMLPKSYRTPTSSASSTNSSTNGYTSREQWTLTSPDTTSGATSQSWSKTLKPRTPGFGAKEFNHSYVNSRNQSTLRLAASVSENPLSTTTNSRRTRHTGSTRTRTTSNQTRLPVAPAPDENLPT